MNDPLTPAERKGATKLITTGLGLKAGQDVLIVADETTQEVAVALAEAALEQGITPGIYLVPLSQQRQDPEIGRLPPALMAAIGASGALCTVLAAGHETLAFRKALLESAEQAARSIAHMPGATREVLVAANANGGNIEGRNLALARGLIFGRELIVTSRDQTGQAYRLTLDLGVWARLPILSDAKIARGTWSNLPGGEVYIAPITGDGELLVDGSIDRTLLDDPILCRFQGGRLVDWGPKDTKAYRYLADIKEQCRKAGDHDWDCIGELGIGTNDGIQSLGTCSMLNEKMLGSCHIGLGHSKEFGGERDSNIQIKLVCRAPTIEIDGKRWIEQGRHLYDLDDPGEDYRDVEQGTDWGNGRIVLTGQSIDIEHERLARVCYNMQNQRYRLAVGNRETASLAARLYRAIDPSGECSLDELAQRAGLTRAAVTPVLTVMARYQVIEIIR